MHYGSGILSAAMVGWFADGTPWTMGWILGSCGFGSLAASLIAQRLVLRLSAATKYAA
jgi:DHA1 family bicyclomycin/chloramphenicol resistance-like MFS transporter